MLNQNNIVYLVIWALAIGLATAFVYTNVQRSALSLFITKLIEKGCFNENTASTLSDLGLNKSKASIVTRACNSHHGLKRIIVLTQIKSNNNDDELFYIFGKKKIYKYHLNTQNTQEILKKYHFKAMPFYQIVLFVAALILTAFLLTKAYDIFYNYVYIPDIEEQTEINNQDNNNLPIIPENDTPDNIPQTGDDKASSEEMDKPTIPTIPTIPTLS